jgi:hypothetical protein
MAGDTAPSSADADPDADAEATAPSFAIPAHPERCFPYDEGVTYEGSTVFRLRPAADRSQERLVSLVEAVLAAGPYRHGDHYDLPMALYLVRDEETADVFRVAVRDGQVRLHVLPDTESAGLRAFYERLTARSDTDWRVDCRTEY